MAKEALYVTLARFRCHWGNKKLGFLEKKSHFSFYCLNGNENASTVSGRQTWFQVAKISRKVTSCASNIHFLLEAGSACNKLYNIQEFF